MKRGKLFVIAGIFCALIAPLNAESEAEADLSELSKEITTEASASETQVSVEPQEKTVGMQILFSQVFTGAIFNKIDIQLLDEDFTLQLTNTDSASLEIKSNLEKSCPVVTQDEKNLKIVQKDKKSKIEGRKCIVTLTLPRNYPPESFSLSTANGLITLSDLEAQTIKISSDTGNLNAQKLTGIKSLALSTVAGLWEVSQIDSANLSAETKRGELNLFEINAKAFSISTDKGNALAIFSFPFVQTSSVETNTGTIWLGLTKESVFYNTITVTKGHYYCEFPSDTKGPELRAKANKGEIKVNAATNIEATVAL